MSEAFPCAVCDEVFTKAFELKKHKATHDNPNSVFYCSHCPFITLQKKNLAVHVKNHTGEKDLPCPHTISLEQPCGYRTNDPAALSKHRQKMHGYIPPPNRSRPKMKLSAIAAQKRTEIQPWRRRRTQPTAITPRQRHTFACKPQRPDGYSGNGTASTPFVPLENPDDAMDEDYDDCNTTLVSTDDETGLDTLYDASLRPNWLAQYEMSYSEFDMSGTGQQLEILPKDCPFDPTGYDEPEDRGSLCPEWMRELRLEGWTSSQ